MAMALLGWIRTAGVGQGLMAPAARRLTGWRNADPSPQRSCERSGSLSKAPRMRRSSLGSAGAQQEAVRVPRRWENQERPATRTTKAPSSTNVMNASDHSGRGQPAYVLVLRPSSPDSGGPPHRRYSASLNVIDSTARVDWATRVVPREIRCAVPCPGVPRWLSGHDGVALVRLEVGHRRAPPMGGRKVLG